MSRLRERLRRPAADDGFTLIEILVALTVVALVAAGVVPLLIVGTQAAAAARLNTQAKNLAQQRIESMRDLQFHVDRQNGPFIDLLDLYYTDLNTTATTRTRGAITAPGQTETQTVQWVASGAAAPEPAGPLYRVVINQVPGYTGFRQIIDTQFLNQSGTAVPAAQFATYTSQVEGKDQPPSLILGVTVITSWTVRGQAKSYAMYTRIADGRGLVAALTSQGRGEFLRLTSSGPTGNPLTVDVGVAEADGSQSTGSLATADVKALDAEDPSSTAVRGATGVATDPGTAAVNSPVANVPAGTSACTWVWAGHSSVADVTGSASGGLPQVPSDVGTAIPPTNQTSASLLGNAGNNACGVFSFANQSTSYDSHLMLATGTPLVRVPDPNSSAPVVTGSAWVNATTAAASPHSVASGAGASSSQPVQLFPGLPFLPSGRGLVEISLSASSLSCQSNVTAGSPPALSATGSYTVTLTYFKSTNTSGGVTPVSTTYTWSSSSSSADPLASLDPASIVVYQNGSTILRLSDYISSWSTTRSLTESPTSGVHQLGGVVNVTTQPVRGASDSTSSVGVQVGSLSCVADDSR